MAVGAVLFRIDCFVKGRISKFTYGVSCAFIYDPSDQAHVKRKHTTFIDDLGDECVPGAFETMLSKVRYRISLIQFALLTDRFQGTKVLESREIRTSLHMVRAGAPPKDAMAEIIKYDGNKKQPRWKDLQPSITLDFIVRCVRSADDRIAKFETLCHVVADISAAPCSLERGLHGRMCYSREFDVVLLVGLTELKAQIRWIDSKTVCISIGTTSG